MIKKLFTRLIYLPGDVIEKICTEADKGNYRPAFIALAICLIITAAFEVPH